MDVREKLVELLMQKGFGVEGATIAADHLIANGVTLSAEVEELKAENRILSQKRANIFEIVNAYERGKIAGANKWISVKDRLPDEKGEYLVAFHPCWWDDVHEDKTFVGTDTFRGKTTWAKKKFQRVTHWMPLPQPPKGE